MGKDNYYTKYDEALTDNEIYNYALIVDEFMIGKITYKELQEKFSELYGIDVSVEINSKSGLTLEERADFANRLIKEDYNYNDIAGFILNGRYLNNVLFKMDYKAIEVLADNNIPHYMEAYKRILETQLHYSYDKNEKLKAERNMWKRKIEELENKLVIDSDELTSYVVKAVKSETPVNNTKVVYLDENGELKTTGPKLTKKKEK